MAKINTSIWMADAPIPEILRPPFIAIGATSLLSEFFSRVAASREPGELWICSPFVDQNFLDTAAVLSGIAHKDVSLCILTSNEKNAANACHALGRFAWASFVLGARETLHAKIYLYLSARPERLCLVGSHNLTKAGFSWNFEAGVLMGSVGTDAVSEMIHQVHTTLEAEMRASEILDPRTFDQDPLSIV